MLSYKKAQILTIGWRSFICILSYVLVLTEETEEYTLSITLLVGLVKHIIALTVFVGVCRHITKF